MLFHVYKVVDGRIYHIITTAKEEVAASITKARRDCIIIKAPNRRVAARMAHAQISSTTP